MTTLRIPYGEDGLPLFIQTPDGYGKVGDNPGGYVHNGSECSIIQTGFNIVDSIEVSGTGTDADGVYPINGTLNSKPKFSHETVTSHIEWDGANWNVTGVPDDWQHATASGTFPDKTGWPVGGIGGSPAPTLTYNSFYVESGEFAKKTYADYLAHPNGSYNLWLKVISSGGVCLVKEAPQYPLARGFLPAEVERNESWAGNSGCISNGALRDVDGELITDVDGEVLFTA